MDNKPIPEAFNEKLATERLRLGDIHVERLPAKARARRATATACQYRYRGERGDQWCRELLRERFGERKREWLAQFLDKNGLASRATCERVLSLAPAHGQSCALDWVRAVVGGKRTSEDGFAVGEQRRGAANEPPAAVHLLSVWSPSHGSGLSATALDAQRTEITPAPGVLATRSRLDLAGCLSVDALNPQRDRAAPVKHHAECGRLRATGARR